MFDGADMDYFEIEKSSKVSTFLLLHFLCLVLFSSSRIGDNAGDNMVRLNNFFPCFLLFFLAAGSYTLSHSFFQQFEEFQNLTF